MIRNEQIIWQINSLDVSDKLKNNIKIQEYILDMYDIYDDLTLEDISINDEDDLKGILLDLHKDRKTNRYKYHSTILFIENELDGYDIIEKIVFDIKNNKLNKIIVPGNICKIQTRKFDSNNIEIQRIKTYEKYRPFRIIHDNNINEYNKKNITKEDLYFKYEDVQTLFSREIFMYKLTRNSNIGTAQLEIFFPGTAIRDRYELILKAIQLDYEKIDELNTYYDIETMINDLRISYMFIDNMKEKENRLKEIDIYNQMNNRKFSKKQYKSLLLEKIFELDNKNTINELRNMIVNSNYFNKQKIKRIK